MTLRRMDVPQAPHNSNQFLMDDHLLANCTFNDFSTSQSSSSLSSPVSPHDQVIPGEDAYVYDTYDAEMRQSFYERDFEEVYRESKAQMLEEKNREELEKGVVELENRAAMLAKLQAIMEENAALRLQQQ